MDDFEHRVHVDIGRVRYPGQEAIARLRAEVESLRADAERYRWLREQHWNDSPMCVVMNPRACVKLGSDCPSDERLDAAVDAARAAQGDKT